MKNINSLKISSLVLLMLMLVMTSCRMEKRVYMAGYHTELLTNHKAHNKNYRKNTLCTSFQKDNSRQSDRTLALTGEQTIIESSKVKDNIIIGDDKMNIIASFDNKQISLQLQKKNNLNVQFAQTQNKVKSFNDCSFKSKLNNEKIQLTKKMNKLFLSNGIFCKNINGYNREIKHENDEPDWALFFLCLILGIGMLVGGIAVLSVPTSGTSVGGLLLVIWGAIFTIGSFFTL